MWIIAVILIVPAVATICAIIVGGRYDKRDDYNQEDFMLCRWIK